MFLHSMGWSFLQFANPFPWIAEQFVNVFVVVRRPLVARGLLGLRQVPDKWRVFADKAKSRPKGDRSLYQRSAKKALVPLTAFSLARKTLDVVALSGHLDRMYVFGRVRFALVIRLRNSTLCYDVQILVCIAAL